MADVKPIVSFATDLALGASLFSDAPIFSKIHNQTNRYNFGAEIMRTHYYFRAAL